MVEMGTGMAEPLAAPTAPPASPVAAQALAQPGHRTGHLTSAWGRTSHGLSHGTWLHGWHAMTNLPALEKPSGERRAPSPCDTRWLLLGWAGWAMPRGAAGQAPSTARAGVLCPGTPPDDALLAGVVQGHEELRLLPDVADEIADAEVEVVRG